jgi:hypothetical protein
LTTEAVLGLLKSSIFISTLFIVSIFRESDLIVIK